jgi:hypothetical protein
MELHGILQIPCGLQPSAGGGHCASVVQCALQCGPFDGYVKQKSDAQLLSSAQGHVSSRLVVPLHMALESPEDPSSLASFAASLIESIAASIRIVQSQDP